MLVVVRFGGRWPLLVGPTFFLKPRVLSVTYFTQIEAQKTSADSSDIFT